MLNVLANTGAGMLGFWNGEFGVILTDDAGGYEAMSAAWDAYAEGDD